MNVLEFRKITTQDDVDHYYNDGQAWSRVYEYPFVIKKILNFYKPGNSIHNTSWGFEGLHVLFKEKLEKSFNNVVHSDIKHSNLSNTFHYDITKEPEPDHIERYDFVLNISTMEEVNHDHLSVFQNLFRQVKKGGFLLLLSTYLVCRHKFEDLFSRKIDNGPAPISGKNSVVKNVIYSHLNCGVMVVEK